MTADPSAVWRHPPRDMPAILDRCISEGTAKAESRDIAVFFRADDVAAPGRNMERLLQLFKHYDVPLCLAVVPAWLTRPRWGHLLSQGRGAEDLWCWHQHGWRHVNHEPQGKKSEFGAARSREETETDLHQGRDRLTRLMGRHFSPFFTPPWNRCHGATLALLEELGYDGISRNRGCQPPVAGALTEVNINIDLHTRKEKTAEAAWHALLDELIRGMADGWCGVMLHHQRMNEAAFVFLEALLRQLARHSRFQLHHFNSLKCNVRFLRQHLNIGETASNKGVVQDR